MADELHRHVAHSIRALHARHDSDASQPVEYINLAMNGRSSKSFRAEGLWAPALAA